PALRPASFTLRAGDQANLEDCAAGLVEAGYERVDQVAERGQFALRGGLLDVFAVTAEHAARLDFFGEEIESMRWFSTFSQRSLGETPELEIAPAAELGSEHRELIELAGEARSEGEAVPELAELLPVDRFMAPLELVGDAVRVVVGAEEEIAPALEDHWSDACSIASSHGTGTPQLYVSPNAVSDALAERCRVWLSALSAGQELEVRAQAAQPAARSLAQAEAELERLVRSGYRVVVAFGQRGEGERTAYNLARLRASWLDEPQAAGAPVPELPPSADGSASLTFVHANLREGFVAP
ncbi:MAG: transcription-repair coupling factor, partial [Solirubrobacteraceae bacterium]